MPRCDTPHAMIGCGCEARFTREAVMTGRMEWCGVGSVLRVASRVAYAVIACMAAISVASGRGEAASFPPSEKLLPASTRVWVSVADPQALRKRFERSALGGLVYDPLMSTFLDGLRQQGRSSADPLRGTLEITLEEVEKIAGGEIALGVIERTDGKLATVALIDTSGRETEVASVVEAVLGRVAAKGGKPLAAPPSIKAFSVPVPPPPASGAAVPAATAAGPSAAVATRQLAITVAPGCVIVGDGYDAVGEMSATIDKAKANAAGGRADPLAAVPAFAKVMERCGKGVPATAATVRWFVDPLAYLAADRRTFPPTKNKKGPDYVAILRRQGFDAVNGAGGYLFFGEGNVDLRHNTLIHAPPRNGRPADGPDRFEKAARMLRFPNVAGLAPAAWVPGGAASWVSFEWDIANAFDSMQPLVDDVVGEAGVFEDVIASLEEDPDGPQIKVRDDLIKHLGKRCAVASDHESPIDPDCERMLIAIETSNPEAVATVISKGMTSESEVREVKAGGHLIWETVKPAATAERDAGASDGDDAAGRRRARQRERQEKETVWPNLSVAVAHGHIFLASHRDFLERVLNNPRTSSIIEDGGYQDVAAELKQLLGGDWAMSSFSRTEKAIRPAYELLRAGRLPESKSLAGTLLRRVLEGDQPQNGQRRGASQDPTQDPGRGKQKVDGSSLPEFEQISRYFGLNGMSMQSTPEGWYLVGVGLWDGGKQPAATPDAK
jgi:hypothetical protein